MKGGTDQRPASHFAGWYERLPFDPAENATLWRSISLSWIVHTALAGGLLIYGFTLSAQGEITSKAGPPPQQPVAAAFVFEEPEPDIKPHLIPQSVAETTTEPAQETPPPTEVKKQKKSKKVRTVRRSRAKKRATKRPSTEPTQVAAIAPAVETSTAATVAPDTEPAPTVASGPTTMAPSTTNDGGVKSLVDQNGLLKSYVKTLSRAVRKRRAYPRAAKLAGLEGRAVVRIVLTESGAIVAIELETSSGHDILDRAALEAARSVERLPAAPSDLDWGTRAIKVPFRFKVTT